MEEFENQQYRERLRRFFLFSSNSVFYRMTMAFGLFFLGPLLGFLFLSVKTNLFGTNELLYCLVGLLISTFFGYIIMRQISNGIARVEHRMADKLERFDRARKVGDDELQNISSFADAMSESIEAAGNALNRRMSEIHALKEIGSLSTPLINAQSLATISLKRSMEVIEADGGAVVLVTGKKGVCYLTHGSGIHLKKNQTFLVTDFPWQDAIKEQSPSFLKSENGGQWSKYFGDSCSQVVLAPYGRFGKTVAFALLTAGEEVEWDQTTLGFLSTYFSAIGNTLKMIEIDKQKKETTDELKTVLSLIKIINANPREEDLLTVITRRVEQIIPHHWIGLAMKNENGEGLYLSHSFSKIAPEIKTGSRIEDNRSLFHLAMHKEDSISVDNLTVKNEYYEKNLFHQLELKSCVLASLNSSGKAVGVICLGNEKIKGFGRKEKRLFALVGKSVSIALDQSRAFARERAKRTELEILNKIGSALSSHTIRANKVLPYVLDRVAELVEVEAASIMLLEFDSLVVEAAKGEFSKELKKLKFSLNHGVAGYVVATGEPVTVEDVRENPNFLSAVDEKTGFETRSLLCVPLISGGRVIGVIELLNRLGRPFSKQDVQAVKAVAASTAIALENSRLYSESSHIAKKEKFIRTIFQRYVPEEIVTDILQRGEPNRMAVGQKRIVTVFNVDIRGYSKMSKQASTEDVVHILNHFFKRMGHIIIKHKGLVDKYLGDGMLAIFGAPVTTPNPALDAVLAAKEMVSTIEAVSILSIDRCGIPIKIGVSINTGEAIVGNIGFTKKMEYTVIGDVVNEAFRIQDLTRGKENSILIGEATYNQVRSAVKTRPYGLKKLDSSLVNVYEVVTDEKGDSPVNSYAAGDQTVNIH